jgi:hypothetical protein
MTTYYEDTSMAELQYDCCGYCLGRLGKIYRSVKLVNRMPEGPQ